MKSKWYVLDRVVGIILIVMGFDFLKGPTRIKGGLIIDGWQGVFLGISLVILGIYFGLFKDGLARYVFRDRNPKIK